MIRSALLMLAVMPLTGCIHHQIAFIDDSEWHYEIEGSSVSAPLSISVDEASRTGDLEISSFTAGAANRWHARYGEMFMQALAVEMDQFAPRHTLNAGAAGAGAWRLDLAIPEYNFSSFSARTSVTAVVVDPGGRERLRERYSAVGDSNAGRVVGLGAFGMKSAIRQSTLDAYRKILAELREDLSQLIR